MTGKLATEESACLANHFLIAMPNLADPNFAHTVTLLCEHNAAGAMGLIINRPTEVKLCDLFEHLELEASENSPREQIVYAGGPVQRDRGFVIHPPDDNNWDATARISPEVAITTSRDILAALARGEGPEQSLVALGYAGWGSGQLEEELAQNAWLSGPIDSKVIFETDTSRRWYAAAANMGIDISLLSSESGHA
ncbi:YqgE/AlgH family protein [Halorhodospira halochloris]|uniref:YqgE/AlgH family protein n=1 Tax=Halorhodospira halochloris TaxID=1052 RepID=UPI001EE98CFA|nr:YqgE/AlgH family protein [Halorhodospira halochloris]MCG5529431.1 YqgE/AlgH family protein [Halorhodospira halochloris]MCG5547414.1 YqgE/AlgH family protein [Halorhodospira halochloris]